MGLQEKVAALVEAQRLPLRKAAPFLAANGWPVYPCTEGGKIPLNDHGLSEATTDAQMVERWWSRWPGANIGVATGAKSGFDVIDVDVREGRSGYDAFAKAATRFGLGNWMLRVQTPSCGMHYYYPAAEKKPQRNWVNAAAAIDFRGAGGGIIVPPSWGQCTHDIDCDADLDLPYTLIAAKHSGRPIDAAGLRDFLDPEAARRRLAGVLRRPNLRAPRTEYLANWLAGRAEGERNHSLFWAACRMVEGGHPLDIALGVLVPAAGLCGLMETESANTIRSAYRHCQPPSPPPVQTPMQVRELRR